MRSNVAAGKIEEAARERFKMTAKSSLVRDHKRGLVTKGRAAA